MQSLDYLDHLQRESARFLTAVLAAAPGAQVPSCPEWTADDLLWHLAEVQWFWSEIVRSGTDDPEPVQAAKPARPGNREGLAEFYRVASGGLLAALAAASPEDAAWTWSDDHTVGFIRRRQAHEALMHRVDAELAAGLRTPLDPLLAADGVDEALRVMYSGLPAWGTYTPTAGPLRLTATDTAAGWLLTVGRFVGTEPESGRAYDEAVLEIADDPARGDDVEAAAVVSGSAGDLDCHLWNRPTLRPVERTGDPAALAAFDAVLAEGIQ
jgi:uncharacterized protein (TIGR03083 family)